MTKVFFKEDGRHRNWKIALVASIIVVPLVYVWIMQLRQHSAAEAMASTLLPITLVSLLATGWYVLMLRIARLHTEIDQEGIHFRFFPFHKQTQHIAWNEVAGYRIIKTSLLGHMSGWGVHYESQEPHYSVSGKNGIELILENGQHLFIGSNKPKKLRRVLTKKVELPKMIANSEI